MPACEAARAVDHQGIVGYGHFEVDTGRVGHRGLPFEDGSNALANGSVRLTVPWDKAALCLWTIRRQIGNTE